MVVIHNSQRAASEMVLWADREVGTILRGFRVSRKGGGIVNFACETGKMRHRAQIK
jgi:hypothetical protein